MQTLCFFGPDVLCRRGSILLNSQSRNHAGSAAWSFQNGLLDTQYEAFSPESHGVELTFVVVSMYHDVPTLGIVSSEFRECPDCTAFSPAWG